MCRLMKKSYMLSTGHGLPGRGLPGSAWPALGLRELMLSIKAIPGT